VNIDPVAAGIREAEHIEAETRYRQQLAQEMYQAGYGAAEADMVSGDVLCGDGWGCLRH